MKGTGRTRSRIETFGDRPLRDAFPGAVHSPYACPVCGILITAHKIARRWGRRYYLWVARPDGTISVCTDELVGVFPPPRR